MCQTMPVKIKEIEGGQATLTDGRRVDLGLLKNLKVGNWVLAYANVVIRKVTDKEAKETLNLFKH